MNLSQKYDCALITFRLSTQSICNINNPPNLNQVKTCKELIAENITSAGKRNLAFRPHH